MEKYDETAPLNPFIAEVCTHYPEKFGVGSTDKEVCNCEDCFYCDPDASQLCSDTA